MLPYSLPFLGHITSVFNINGLLEAARKRAPHDVFSLKVFGAKIHIILSPSLIQALIAQRPDVLDADSVIWTILHNVGGIANEWKDRLDPAMPGLYQAAHSLLMREPGLGKIVAITVSNLEQTLPAMFTFSPRPVDQHAWERKGNAHPVESPSTNGPAVEVDLLKLVLDYVGHQALPSIFGPDYLGNNPDTFTDLWEFNNGFLLLAAGLPRWLPYPPLRRAYAARDRLDLALTELERMMDAHVAGETLPPGWGRIDQVSPLLFERCAVYASHGIPHAVRAQGELSVLWALNANSNFIVFWLLIRILSTSGLAARVREETAPHVRVTPHASAFGAPEAPSVAIDAQALTSQCALLKACYIESLRLDSAPWSHRRVVKDVTLTDTSHDTPRPFKLEAGAWAQVPFGLHFNDARHFAQPEAFIPERHLVVTGEDEDGAGGGQRAEWGTVRAFGGGAHACKGRALAEKEVLVCVAGMLALWEIEPVGGVWRVPGHGKATGVLMPLTDVRVTFTRRAGPAGAYEAGP